MTRDFVRRKVSRGDWHGMVSSQDEWAAAFVTWAATARSAEDRLFVMDQASYLLSVCPGMAPKIAHLTNPLTFD
jgi:hypothetical protein